MAVEAVEMMIDARAALLVSLALSNATSCRIRLRSRKG
jgi:hypothetical protein